MLVVFKGSEHLSFVRRMALREASRNAHALAALTGTPWGERQRQPPRSCCDRRTSGSLSTPESRRHSRTSALALRSGWRPGWKAREHVDLPWRRRGPSLVFTIEAAWAMIHNAECMAVWTLPRIGSMRERRRPADTRRGSEPAVLCRRARSQEMGWVGKHAQ